MSNRNFLIACAVAAVAIYLYLRSLGYYPTEEEKTYIRNRMYEFAQRGILAAWLYGIYTPSDDSRLNAYRHQLYWNPEQAAEMYGIDVGWYTGIPGYPGTGSLPDRSWMPTE